jgi:hypothetical protein
MKIKKDRSAAAPEAWLSMKIKKDRSAAAPGGMVKYED